MSRPLTYLLVLATIAGLALAGLLLWQAKVPNEPLSDAKKPSSATSATALPTNWSEQSLTLGKESFRLAVPPAVEVHRVQPTIIELKYIGPKSEPNTEIADGYLISLQLGTSTQQFISPTRATSSLSLGEHTATTYTATSMLGSSVQYYVWSVTPDSVLQAGVMVAGEQAPAYRQEVQRILRSIR